MIRAEKILNQQNSINKYDKIYQLHFIFWCVSFKGLPLKLNKQFNQNNLINSAILFICYYKLQFKKKETSNNFFKNNLMPQLFINIYLAIQFRTKILFRSTRKSHNLKFQKCKLHCIFFVSLVSHNPLSRGSRFPNIYYFLQLFHSCYDTVANKSHFVIFSKKISRALYNTIFQIKIEFNKNAKLLKMLKKCCDICTFFTHPLMLDYTSLLRNKQWELNFQTLLKIKFSKIQSW
eukprot:TRINITY_DN3474_c0_g5_i2.p1 TRINITY_DN3474_c0_g5~~TRINITY_DN3474_c0_g5_i2.p1  ORF type:complete len:234 (-),score=-15.56 TRINITY_DN3474_c0_g5_i2:230-931(-)